MNTNVKLTEVLEVAATLGVQTAVGSTATRITSSWVHVGEYLRLKGNFIAGDIGSGASGVCSIRQATDSSGTSAKVVGSTATLDTDNTSTTIDVSVSDMDFANGFVYAAVSVLPAVGSVPVGAQLEGLKKYAP